jgi:hypothetical protein
MFPPVSPPSCPWCTGQLSTGLPAGKAGLRPPAFSHRSASEKRNPCLRVQGTGPYTTLTLTKLRWINFQAAELPTPHRRKVKEIL